MIVSLRPGRPPIVIEIHAPYTWPDQVTGQPTSYLAGFPDPGAREKAMAHAKGHGWRVAG